MQIDSNIFPLLGYVILAIGFGYNIKNKQNLFQNKLVVLGYVVVIFGYLLNSTHHGLTIFKIQLTKINYGNLLLALFYLFSFLIDINDERKNYDVLALVGHLLLIKDTDKDLNTVGYISLFAYHIQYIIKSFKYSDKSNKIFLTGSIFIAIFLNIKIFRNLLKDNIKDELINL
jgi:hypothetical protein